MLHWLAAICMGALGASLGSFLNVVVHRLPRGMSIVAPASRCPRCRAPIRWYHNIPVVSWLMLRGRCVDCGSRIAIRYPLVESVTAAFFVVAWVTEPQPVAASAWHGADASGPGSPIMRLAAAAYHGLLATWLFCFWLTEREAGHTGARLFPRSLAAWGVVCGPMLYAAAATVWRRLAIDEASFGSVLQQTLPAVEHRGLGILAGVLLSGAAWPALACGPLGSKDRLAGAAGLLVVGGFLGPVPAMAAAVAASMALLVGACGALWLARMGTPSWTTCLLCIMLAWLSARSVIDPWLFSAYQTAGKAVFGGGAIVATGALSLAAAALCAKPPAR